MCRWVSSFYTHMKANLVFNGKASTSFSIRRGCGQGSPISQYLLFLFAEVLACKIREDKNIKVIKIADMEFKTGQLDTSLLLN